MMGGMRICCTRNTGRLAEYGLIGWSDDKKGTHSMWYWSMIENLVCSRYMRDSSMPQAAWETINPTRSKRPDSGTKKVSHFRHFA